MPGSPILPNPHWVSDRMKIVSPQKPDTGIAKRPRSASAADAAQAFVNLVVFPPHLLQRFQRPAVAGGLGRLGLASRGKFCGLTFITGLPLGLLLDEPALLDRCRCRSRSRADQKSKHDAYREIQSRRSFAGISQPGRWAP